MAIGMPSAAIDDKIADRLWESSKVLDELVKAPDAGIPKDLLRRAECVVVIPAVKKAALGFGGSLVMEPRHVARIKGKVHLGRR